MRYEPILVTELTTIGRHIDHYCSTPRPLLVAASTYSGSRHPTAGIDITLLTPLEDRLLETVAAYGNRKALRRRVKGVPP